MVSRDYKYKDITDDSLFDEIIENFDNDFFKSIKLMSLIFLYTYQENYDKTEEFIK